MRPDKRKSVKRNDEVASGDFVTAAPSASVMMISVKETGVSRALERTKKAFSETRKHLTSCVVAAYSIAHYARSESSAWIEICNRAEWSNFKGAPPSPDRPDTALGYVMRLSVGLNSRDVLKKASCYTLALQRMFDQRVPPTAVEQRIREAGGLRELEKMQAKKRTPKPLSRAYKHPASKGPQRNHSSELMQLFVTVREFEIAVIKLYLDDYEGCSAEVTQRMQNGLKAMLSERVKELKNGAKPNAIFHPIMDCAKQLDG